MLLKLNLQRFASPEVGTNPETWLLNSTLVLGSKSWNYNINFKSNDVLYKSITYTFESPLSAYLNYGTSTGGTTVYDTNTLWTDEAYRTITFTNPPTGDLLTWLQANGTKQTAPSTSQVSIDLTTLSGWGNVTSGNHVIQVVAKADNYRDSEKSTAVSFTKGSATVTLSAGTYRFNETLNIAEGTDINQNITGKMNTLTANNTYGTQKAFISISINYTSEGTGTQIVNILDETQVDVLIYEGGNWMYLNDDVGENLTTTDTTKLRTITIETDQQVSQEFKTWFDNNTNVVTDHTLTITNSSSSVDTLRVYDSNSGFQGNLLTTISKGSTSEVNIPTNYVYFACPNATEVFFTLSNVNPSNSIVQDSGGMDYIACKINQNGSCTITIG